MYCSLNVQTQRDAGIRTRASGKVQSSSLAWRQEDVPERDCHVIQEHDDVADGIPERLHSIGFVHWNQPPAGAELVHVMMGYDLEGESGYEKSEPDEEYLPVILIGIGHGIQSTERWNRKSRLGRAQSAA